MTFREKLQQEHPDEVNEAYGGGCSGCPSNYGYEDENNVQFSECLTGEFCGRCWDREMPETEDEEAAAEKPDPVNAPSHYTAGGYECWDVMEAVFGPEAVYHFCMLNAWKYMWRAGKKDDLLQDLRKAAKNLEKAIEVKEKQENERQAD